MTYINRRSDAHLRPASASQGHVGAGHSNFCKRSWVANQHQPWPHLNTLRSFGWLVRASRSSPKRVPANSARLAGWPPPTLATSCMVAPNLGTRQPQLAWDGHASPYCSSIHTRAQRPLNDIFTRECIVGNCQFRNSETQANKRTPIANKRIRDAEVSICLLFFGTNLIDFEAYVWRLWIRGLH